MTDFSPREIVSELDRFIVGQRDAKRAVAIALRNRWRRQQLDPELREEVMPKNILMIGPTGVGKTEIARRLARLARAPFLKVEATKFTEVGYVGREVDSIVKELVDIAVKQTREEEVSKVRPRATDAAEERILDALLPRPRGPGVPDAANGDETRQKFRKMLREGRLDEREIDIEMRAVPVGLEIMGPPGMEEMTQQLQQVFQGLGAGRTRTKKMRIGEARCHVLEIGAKFGGNVMPGIAGANRVHVLRPALLGDLQPLAQRRLQHGKPIGHHFGQDPGALTAAGD